MCISDWQLGPLVQAKQGYVVYRIRIKRGDRKKRVAKGIVYGKPCHAGIKKWKALARFRALAVCVV